MKTQGKRIDLKDAARSMCPVDRCPEVETAKPPIQTGPQFETGWLQQKLAQSSHRTRNTERGQFWLNGRFNPGTWENDVLELVLVLAACDSTPLWTCPFVFGGAPFCFWFKWKKQNPPDSGSPLLAIDSTLGVSLGLVFSAKTVLHWDWN